MKGYESTARNALCSSRMEGIKDVLREQRHRVTERPVHVEQTLWAQAGPSRTLHAVEACALLGLEKGTRAATVCRSQKSPPLGEGGRAGSCRGAVGQAGQGGECSVLRVSCVGWEDGKQSSEGSAVSRCSCGEGS